MVGNPTPGILENLRSLEFPTIFGGAGCYMDVSENSGVLPTPQIIH